MKTGIRYLQILVGDFVTVCMYPYVTVVAGYLYSTTTSHQSPGYLLMWPWSTWTHPQREMCIIVFLKLKKLLTKLPRKTLIAAQWTYPISFFVGEPNFLANTAILSWFVELAIKHGKKQMRWGEDTSSVRCILSRLKDIRPQCQLIHQPWHIVGIRNRLQKRLSSASLLAAFRRSRHTSCPPCSPRRSAGRPEFNGTNSN